MKFKEILKKAWLPALTVLAICAGAVVLNATMRTSEAQQLEQTAISGIQPTAPAPENMEIEASGEITADTAVTPTPAPAPEAQPMFKPTGDYQYILVKNKDGIEPDAQDLDSFEAGRTVAGLMEAVFGEAFTSASHDIYLSYRNDSGSAVRGYDVLVGSSSWNKATFTGYIDSITGVVTQIRKNTPKSEEVKKSINESEIRSVMETAQNDARLTDTAKNLINARFANGRTIENVTVDGIQADLYSPIHDVLADCIVGLNKGDCYLVRIAYPSCEVVMFEVYPIGWEGLWGYMSAADQTDTATGIEGPAKETPAPTTAPVSTSKPAQ